MNIKQKSRIALSAIAIFAMVGGAYAFKANRSVTSYCKTTSTGLPTITYQGRSFSATATGTIYCTLDPLTTTATRAVTYVNL
jgi:hypothetical protein